MAAIVFLGWMWSTIGPRDAQQTRAIAVREDPSVPVADTAIVVAGVACLGAVGFVLIEASSSPGGTKAPLIAIGVASVALSWATLHTIFTLRYARIYYPPQRGRHRFQTRRTRPPMSTSPTWPSPSG